MKNRIVLYLSLMLCFTTTLSSQVVKDYNPSIQKTSHIQYFKPAETHLFAGDCMPFYLNGTLYLYWLLDEGHHAGLGGLGGHQWALSTTTDLINWKHYPVALGIDEDWEKSICTGSVIVDKNKMYAFYSTRVKEGDNVHEQLSYAISTDGGFSFKKQKPNPFYYAPKECVSRDFRDPRVFKGPEGMFHLFISGYEKNPDFDGQGGYLVHLISKDLKNWKETESPLKGQNGVPECSDYFKWNDWHYLIYSTHGHTYYVRSKQAYGPWEYPPFQPMVEKWVSVGKTAEFKSGRRILASYMPSKPDNKDSDGMIWGGNIFLRELFQDKNGILTVGRLPEVAPEMKATPAPAIVASEHTNGILSANGKEFTIQSPDGFGLGSMNGLPKQYRIKMTIEPNGNYDEMGLYLKSTDKHKKGYKVSLNANKQLVSLFEANMEGVHHLDKKVTLDITVMNDIIDVYINNERCIANRLEEQKGDNIFLFIKNGTATFKDIELYEIN